MDAAVQRSFGLDSHERPAIVVITLRRDDMLSGQPISDAVLHVGDVITTERDDYIDEIAEGSFQPAL